MCHGYGYGSDVVVDCLLSLTSKIDTNMTHYALWFDMPAANFPVFDQIKPFPCFKSNILAELIFSAFGRIIGRELNPIPMVIKYRS